MDVALYLALIIGFLCLAPVLYPDSFYSGSQEPQSAIKYEYGKM